MKKEYIKPSMKVHELKQRAALLVGSGGDRRAPKEYDDEMGYLPGTGEPHLA
jgi:hypothetical protein